MSEPAMSLPAPDQASLPDCPFPGIEAFSYARHRVFFSRDEETRSLARSIVLHRGVLLYAASGIGKSSLINAGIVPRAIEEGFQPERIRVQPKVGQEIVVEPIRAYADERTAILPSIFIGSGEQSERVVLSVQEFLSCVRKHAGTVSPLLIFDQFEEWITLFEEAATEENRRSLNESRESIRTAISTLINDASQSVKVLIALREDYLANLAPIFRDVPSLPDNYLRLRPLSPSQVSDVIRKPYEKYPGAFQVELGAALATKIREQFDQRVAGGDIQLTEVQIVCRTLFEHEVNGGSADDLFAKKGVQGILEAYLETTLNALEPAAREPAVAVLSRLLTSSGTRNVVSEDNLVRWLGIEEKIPREVVRTAVQNLEHSARLIRCEPRRGVSYYEINSEFLVPWIQRAAAARETQRQVQALRKQQEKEHKAFRLKLRLRGAYIVAGVVVLLATIAVVRGRRQEKMHLHSVAEALAVRSLMDSGEIAQLLASQAEVIHGKEDSSHFSGVIGTALSHALSEPPGPLGRFAGSIGSMSTDTAARFLAATANSRVLVWDLRHSGTDPEELGEYEFASFQSVALSRDGSQLVAGTRDGHVFLWRLDAIEGEPTILNADSSTVFSVDISPDGRRIAAASRDGFVRVWDLDRGERPGKILPTGGTMAWTVRFADDGNTLFSGSVKGGVQRWDVRLEKPLFSLPGVSLAISADGKWLATGALDGKVRLWRSNNLQKQEHEIAAHRGAVRSVALSRDGSALASVSEDSSVQVWVVRPGVPVRTMLGTHNGWATDARFTHDENGLHSGGTDGELKRWSDVRGESGYPLTISPPRGDSGTVLYAAMNMTARVVAALVSKRSPQSGTRGSPGTLGAISTSGSRAPPTSAWLYDLASAKDTLPFGADTASDAAIALSGDGKSLAATGRDGAIRFLRRDKPGIELVVGQRQDSIRAIALSVDGQLLAAGGNDRDRVVRVWDTQHPAKAPLQLRGVSGRVRSLAFSSDGKSIAAGSDSGTARVWELAHPDSAHEIEAHDGVVRSLTFSSDGKLLATGGSDGKVSIWNVTDPKKTAVVFPAGQAPVTTVLFRQDGRLVFAGSSDGTVAFWSMQEGNASPVQLDTHSGAVRAIALSERADTLYSIGADGRVLGWLIDGQALARRICERAGRNLSFADWRYYVPAEIPYELTCPQHGTPAPNIEAIKKAIRQGDDDNARRMRRAISKLDSSQSYDVDAGITFFRAEQLARKGQVDSAIALARQTSLSIPAPVQKLDGLEKVALVLVTRAKILADSGKFSEATQIVTKIRAFLPAESKLAAKTIPRIVQPIVLDPSMKLAEAGKVDSALVAFGQARMLVGDAKIPAAYWNNLCWYGSLWQRARDVMGACEQAVKMRPLDGNFRDSRGLARALAGDRAGAIEDFAYYVVSGADSATRKERERWIEILNARGNPFTPERLRRLLVE